MDEKIKDLLNEIIILCFLFIIYLLFAYTAIGKYVFEKDFMQILTLILLFILLYIFVEKNKK